MRKAYQWLWRWLEKEAIGWRYWLFLLLAFVVLVAYNALATGFIFGWKFYNSISFVDVFDKKSKEVTSFLLSCEPLFLFAIIAYQLFVEEIKFRFLPLFFATEIAKKIKFRFLIPLTAVASSVLFGWMHGSNLKGGWVFIFIQGATGLILSVVYLKCGGMTNKHLKALSSSYLIHFIFDAMIIGAFLVIVHLLKHMNVDLDFIKKQLEM